MLRFLTLILLSVGILNAYEIYGVDIRDLSILVKYFTADSVEKIHLVHTLGYHILFSISISIIILNYLYYISKNEFIRKLSLKSFLQILFVLSMFFIAPIESIFAISVYTSFGYFSYLILKTDVIDLIWEDLKASGIIGYIIFLGLTIFLSVATSV